MSTPSGRIAVVTGAARGLGLAIARSLGRHGLHVITTAPTAEAAERAASVLRQDGSSAAGHQLDVTDPRSIFRAVADTTHEHGRLDVLVNNAGVAIDRNRPAHGHDMEKVQATFDTNLYGAWRCCMEVIPVMQRHGYGRIVNISSHMGSLSTMMEGGSPAYRLSKLALNGLTCVLAAELADEPILVNAASPGLADTRLAYGAAEQSPQEAAEGLLWLALLPDDGPRGGLFHGREPLPW